MKVNSRPWDSQYSVWELLIALDERNKLDIEDDSEMPGMQKEVFTDLQFTPTDMQRVRVYG